LNLAKIGTVGLVAERESEHSEDSHSSYADVGTGLYQRLSHLHSAIYAGQSAFVEDDIHQKSLDEERLPPTPLGTHRTHAEPERASQRAKHAIYRCAFLRSAGEVNASE